MAVGKSVNAFAKNCEIPESSIRGYLDGASVPGVDKAAAIAEAADVSLDWLALGRGSMRPADASPAYPGGGFREDEGWVTFPVYSARAAAGHGSLNEPGMPTPGVAFDADFAGTFFRVPRNNLAGLYVAGDSMEPTFGDGDVLIVDLSINAIVGEAVYVLVVDEGCLVKRAAPRADGTILLRSDNPAYPPETLDPSKKTHLRIWGRVVGAIKRF